MSVSPKTLLGAPLIKKAVEITTILLFGSSSHKITTINLIVSVFLQISISMT